MSLPLIAAAFLVLLALGYRFYGAFVARRLGLDDSRPTPAHTRRDGTDFEPTRPFYLFGQHFSAIAAAGPIAGPILACDAFGWLPCLLWIGFGVVFVGAVHDFASLAGSVRHDASSVAQIASRWLGPRAGRAMMAFIWIALVYVIVAFTDMTAAAFVSGTEELEAAGRTFNPGGAVAAASVMYLGVALAMGLVERWLSPPLWLASIVFVPLAFGAAWAGTWVSHVLVVGHGTWVLLIVAYCVVASLTPVRYLLQPRGYLGGFILYAAIGAGVIGIFLGGHEVAQPAFKTWDTGAFAGSLFPFLFVTIACGACSGFHGLVCSGTTSKQIDRESHCRPVGFGAMLAEAFVALIALATVMIASADAVRGVAPGKIYGDGIGRFLTLIVGEENLAVATTFGAMAFSTFVFDTLDVAMRLGRYLVQELVGLRGKVGALAATLVTAIPPALVLSASGPGGWRSFWTLFGASNQLLAALTLIALTVWFRRTGRSAWFTAIPSAFVLVITVWALGAIVVAQARRSAGLDAAAFNASAAAALLALAGYVALAAVRALRAAPSPSPGVPPTSRGA